MSMYVQVSNASANELGHKLRHSVQVKAKEVNIHGGRNNGYIRLIG